jgi:hypothetical protein
LISGAGAASAEDLCLGSGGETSDLFRLNFSGTTHTSVGDVVILLGFHAVAQPPTSTRLSAVTGTGFMGVSGVTPFIDLNLRDGAILCNIRLLPGELIGGTFIGTGCSFDPIGIVDCEAGNFRIFQ